MTCENELWHHASRLVVRELVREAEEAEDMTPWLSVEDGDLHVLASCLDGQICVSLSLRELILSPILMDADAQTGIATLAAELREILTLLEDGKHGAKHSPA